MNNLPEGEKIEIVVDLVKTKVQEDEDPEPSAECNKVLYTRNAYKPPQKKVRSPSTDILDMYVKPSEDQLKYDQSLVNTSCLTVFHDLMKTKYIEMINFHREEMLDYIKKDLERQQKIMKILDEIATWTKENYRIEQENVKLRKIILDKESVN